MNRKTFFTLFSSNIIIWSLLLLILNLPAVKGIGQNVQQVIIGSTTGTLSSFNYGPIFRNNGNAGLLNYSRHCHLYTASELGIPSGSKIISLEWLKKDGGMVTGNNMFNVWMLNSSASTLTSPTQWNILTTGATQVFSSTTYSIASGANTYIQAPFTDSFLYNGGGLQIMMDWGKLGFATAPVPFYYTPATGKGLGIVSVAPMNNAVSLATATYGVARPTIRITYVTVPPCVGTPTPGNTISSLPYVCPGTAITLSLQNGTPGGLVTYLWQSANNSAFSSGVLSIGTTSTLAITPTSDKFYRCMVTCAGISTGISTPLFVPMAPTYGCYCSSTALSAADEEIYKFSFGSLRNCSDCSTLAGGLFSVPNLFSNYQYLTLPAVEIGSVVPFSIEIGVCFPYTAQPNRCAVFIDYNQNKSFADPGELVYSSPSATYAGHIESGLITIPTNALTGLTGMRVINSEQGGPITDPCLIYPWGETEDYVVNIVSATSCSGAPVPGNTIVDIEGNCTPAATTHSVCSGKTVPLSIQNLTTGTGVTYQWFNNGIAIAGANLPVYTTPPLTNTQSYYCTVTCINSGLTTASAPITITMTSFLNCYCNSGAGKAADEEILIFTLNTGTNVSNCGSPALGAGSILNRYANYTYLGNFTSILLGTSVSFSMTQDDCDIPPVPYHDFGTAIWIDFNHNASFNDPGEQVFIENVSLMGPRTLTGNIAIPCSAMSGQTRLRISIAEGLFGSLITPCMTYEYGETEDYLIDLIQPVTPCVTPIPSPGNTQSTATVLCDSTIAVLSLQNKCLLANYSYQWFKNSVAISGATSYTYTTPKIFATATYFCTVSCGANSVSSTPLTIVKSTIANVNLTASLPTFCSSGGTPVVLAASSSSSLTYSYNPSTSVSPPSGSIVLASPSTTTTYTVTGTDVLGCTRTSTTSIQVIACSTTLNLKLYIQGYYLSSGLMRPVLLNEGVGTVTTLTDSIDVQLRQSASPYSLVNTRRVGLNTNGTATAIFPALTGTYYIVIKHRSALETWSGTPVPVSGTYDFTTSASKAYGGNMIQVDAGQWGLYSGDLNMDSNIDLLDLTDLENDILNFGFGYLVTDINGDGNSDLLDAAPIENNINDFIFSIRP